MAADTDKSLRTQVMYQIFPRNFSSEGTFNAIIPQLDRIKELGTDIIWLTPIHPVGEKNRKGSLGSPYAIKDYRAVNPEFGTEDDLRRLVSEIHSRGIKCIIDVVYNHTSPDSVLAAEHPEWFWHTSDGSIGPRVTEWSDVADLDYSNRDLWDYQIDTLKMWAGIVDGFRCDVAPLVPLEFWKRAREEVKSIRPDAIWLCESVEPRFITYMRSRGLTALSDSELYQAFDISYDYDIFDEFEAYFKGTGTLKDYAGSVNRQEYIYPDNYVKLRFLENHDRPRAASYIKTPTGLRNATAFVFFQKGLTLLYAGQEVAASHLPSLFDKDDVNWDSRDNVDLSGLMRRMAQIKKLPVFADSSYHVEAISEDVIACIHTQNGGSGKFIGLFSFAGEPCKIKIPHDQENETIADGIYTDLISETEITVSQGCINFIGEPVIISIP